MTVQKQSRFTMEDIEALRNPEKDWLDCSFDVEKLLRRRCRICKEPFLAVSLNSFCKACYRESCSGQSSTNRPRRQMDIESLLKNPSTSYDIGNRWAIGWQEGYWQVFYAGIDAAYRLCVARKYPQNITKKHATFAAAWEWVQHLSDADIEAITVTSVSGQRDAT